MEEIYLSIGSNRSTKIHGENAGIQFSLFAL
jgi:hypothetical protein